MQKNRSARSEAEVPQVLATLHIVVPVRDPALTRVALEKAGNLGADLNVRLRLIDVRVVPYALPLDRPAVNCRLLERKLGALATESKLPVSPELIFARDWEEGFRRALKPRSVVVLGIRKTWWPSRDKRMAARLRKHGHQVIWVECA